MTADYFIVLELSLEKTQEHGTTCHILLHEVTTVNNELWGERSIKGVTHRVSVWEISTKPFSMHFPFTNREKEW